MGPAQAAGGVARGPAPLRETRDERAAQRSMKAGICCGSSGRLEGAQHLGEGVDEVDAEEQVHEPTARQMPSLTTRYTGRRRAARTAARPPPRKGRTAPSRLRWPSGKMAMP